MKLSPGTKRCMKCGKVMPWEESCECLRALGVELRAKAERAVQFNKPAEKKREPGR